MSMSRCNWQFIGLFVLGLVDCSNTKKNNNDDSSSWKRLYYESSSSASDETTAQFLMCTNNDEETSILRSMETTLRQSIEDEDSDVGIYNEGMYRQSRLRRNREEGDDRIDNSRTRKSHRPERTRMITKMTTSRIAQLSNHHNQSHCLSFAQILDTAMTAKMEEPTHVRVGFVQFKNDFFWTTTNTPSFLLSRRVKIFDEMPTKPFSGAIIIVTQEEPRTHPLVVSQRIILAMQTIRLVREAELMRQGKPIMMTKTTRLGPVIAPALPNGTMAPLQSAPTLAASPAEEAIMSLSSSTTTAWIRDFLNKHPQHGLLAIPRDFLLDNFNLANLPTLLHVDSDEFRQAWKTLLQSRYHPQEDESLLSPHEQSQLDHHGQNNTNKTTIRLFLLLHQRFLLSPQGLHWAHRQRHVFGRRCPALACRGRRTVPIGQSDIPGRGVAHMYCPNCHTQWVNWDWQEDPVVDGCAWGTTFGHLLLLVYGVPKQSRKDQLLSSSLSSSKDEQPYVPRIYGFRLHWSASLA